MPVNEIKWLDLVAKPHEPNKIEDSGIKSIPKLKKIKVQTYPPHKTCMQIINLINRKK